MNNADLIERVSNFAPREVVDAVADAIAAADKRIAELEAKIDEAYRKGYATGEEEAERKLSVARGALKTIRWTPQMGELWKIAEEALAQIGGEDAR